MTVEYRDETPFTNDLHTLQQIADALRHKKFGKDVREAIAQAVEKLYGIGPNTVISGSPAGAYATLSELQKAYPNGQQGIFVVGESGKWYLWNARNSTWEEGGNFQSAVSTPELEDAHRWAQNLGGLKSGTLGSAIRSQVTILQAALQNLQSGSITDKRNSNQKYEEINDRLSDIEDMVGALTQTECFSISDNENDDLTDSLTNVLAGKSYYLKTDDTLTRSDMPANALATGNAIENSARRFQNVIDRLEYSYWKNFPILYLNDVPQEFLDYGARKGASADGVTAYMPKYNVRGALKKFKIQGSSSVYFPKKNYTFTFETPVTLNENWGAHKKYVIKGNFNDSSQARNVVSAKIWAQIRQSRVKNNLNLISSNDNQLVDSNGNSLIGCYDDQLCLGKGYGAIDGYPIGVVINGKYHGIYNLNIPKDDWMANMGEGKKEAIISADYSSTKAQYFQAPATMKKSDNGVKDFDIEYTTDEDHADWILPSLNKAIEVALAHHDTDEEYRTALDKYLDVDSAIDYLIMNLLGGDTDGTGKNYLLQTWNGKKWYFAAYDKDSTFGNANWTGNELKGPYDYDINFYMNHRIFNIIVRHMKDDLISRWNELRQGVLSLNNLYTTFGSFIGKIPTSAFNEESYLWPMTPMTTVKDFNSIVFLIDKRLEFLDKEMKKLEQGEI